MRGRNDYVVLTKCVHFDNPAGNQLDANYCVLFCTCLFVPSATECQKIKKGKLSIIFTLSSMDFIS